MGTRKLSDGDSGGWLAGGWVGRTKCSKGLFFLELGFCEGVDNNVDKFVGRMGGWVL